jgi:photosystem II stability/assembly factor-like uncharacterized protein
MHRLLCCLAAALWSALPTHAHDPSAWGGTYRTRDLGGTWLSADAGLFVGGSLDIAVSPADPNQLLYATDTRLLRSDNGGRDWKPEAPGVFYGPTLAVAFLRDGKTALASNAAAVYRTLDGTSWIPSRVPDAAVPARRIVVSMHSDRAVLVGARGLYASSDAGASFTRTGEDILPDEACAAAVFAAEDRLLVVCGGDLWTSVDLATWEPRGTGLPKGGLETIAGDPAFPARLWAGGADRLFVTDDAGARWRAYGEPVGEAGTSIRGIAADAAGQIIVLATHRGALRSHDAGKTWELTEGGTLPVHLEAGPLVRDPQHAATLYMGFSLMPYTEIWRRAEQGSNLLSQIDPVSLAGGAAFLLLLLLAGAFLVRRLMRAQQGNEVAGDRRS